jgi:hypothetical protein
MDDRESPGGKFVKWSVRGLIMGNKFKFCIKNFAKKRNSGRVLSTSLPDYEFGMLSFGFRRSVVL